MQNTSKIEALKAVDKIKKLLQFNEKNNASEAEIETAAGLVRKLLDQHNFTLKGMEEREIEDGIQLQESRPRMSHNHNIYLGRLASTLADAFECRLVYSHFLDDGKTRAWRKSYKFVGYETDVHSCLYFFDYLRVRLLAMANEEICRRPELGASRYIFTNSFIIGASRSIHKRLKREEQPMMATGTSLVIVKERMIEKKMGELFQRLSSAGTKHSSITESGMTAGFEAGSRMPLNYGVKGGSKAGNLIGYAK